MLENILSIAGKPGLFKIISGNKKMIIVESLIDNKRRPAFAHERINALSDIAIYTEDEEMSLREVFAKIQEKEGKNPIALDPKKANEDELRDYFAQILPSYDKDRVRACDIKKLIQWYNLLLKNDLTDFSDPQAAKTEEKAEKSAEKE